MSNKEKFLAGTWFAMDGRMLRYYVNKEGQMLLGIDERHFANVCCIGEKQETFYGFFLTKYVETIIVFSDLKFIEP